MTVQVTAGGEVLLEGICPSEDAETLLRHLSANPAATVDWRACESAHTALIQVLMAAKPKLRGPPAGQALRDWVEPLLTRATP
jgi:hypothetical protein